MAEDVSSGSTGVWTYVDDEELNNLWSHILRQKIQPFLHSPPSTRRPLFAYAHWLVSRTAYRCTLLYSIHNTANTNITDCNTISPASQITDNIDMADYNSLTSAARILDYKSHLIPHSSFQLGSSWTKTSKSHTCKNDVLNLGLRIYGWLKNNYLTWYSRNHYHFRHLTLTPQSKVFLKTPSPSTLVLDHRHTRAAPCHSTLAQDHGNPLPRLPDAAPLFDPSSTLSRHPGAEPSIDLGTTLTLPSRLTLMPTNFYSKALPFNLGSQSNSSHPHPAPCILNQP